MLRTLAECTLQHVEPNLGRVKDELVRVMKERSNASMRLDALVIVRHPSDNFISGIWCITKFAAGIMCVGAMKKLTSEAPCSSRRHGRIPIRSAWS